MKTFSNRGQQAVALIPVPFEQIARKTQPPKKAGRDAVNHPPVPFPLPQHGPDLALPREDEPLKVRRDERNLP